MALLDIPSDRRAEGGGTVGLKLCPFCGCEAQTEFNVVFGFQVICTNEDCFMNEALMHDKKTEQEAIETWNRRAKIDG